MKRFLFLLTIISIVSTSAQTVGTAAPDFELNLLGGGTFKLSAQQGKVVFIFLFGNTCPHCETNGPNTESGIYQVYKGSNEFVALGIDTWNGNSSSVNAFKTKTGISYPLALNGSSVANAYGTTYDRIMVIDKDGILRYKGNAFATTTEVSNAAAAIDTYLAMDPSGGNGGGEETGILSVKDEKELRVYPNPSSDLVTVSGSSLQNFDKVTLTDMGGKTIFSGNVSKTQDIELAVDHLPSGIYALTFQGNKESVSRKLVIR